MANDLNPHDITVYVGGVAYRPMTNYALMLQCTKVAGWQLWMRWNGHKELLGGEYDGEPFCVEVAGMVIVGEKPSAIHDPRPFGWDGMVNRERDRLQCGPGTPDAP